MAELKPKAIPTLTYHFGSADIIVEDVVKVVPLEDGSIGHISEDGAKTLVSAGWLAYTTTGQVDWE